VSVDEKDALLTPLGREEKLRELEREIDELKEKHVAPLEARVTSIESKEDTRDERWKFAFRTLVTTAAGIIIGVVVALITTGVHP
jgi:tetrahydromethanopterin S-methyltransferase subunit F